MENARRRYLECPECGTWTSRTEEFLATNEPVDCYQCGVPVTGATRRLPIEPAKAGPLVV